MTDMVNRVVHKVLVSGMVLSFSIIVVGLMLFQVQGGDGAWVDWQDLPRALQEGKATAIIILGLIVLIATPLCRVIAALLVFALQKDMKFVVISLTVLTVIIIAASLHL